MNMNMEFFNVESVEREDEMGGSWIYLYMKNGAVLQIAPENDIVNFYKDRAAFDAYKPTASFGCDLGSGHHTSDADTVSVIIQKGTKVETVVY